MNFYLDASIVVSSLTQEVRTADAIEWLQVRDVGSLTASTWLVTEVHSALAFKVRTKKLILTDHAIALSNFRRLAASLDLIDPVGSDFREAAAICDRHELGLRAPDALHLAICARTRSRLVTFDSALGSAARVIGVSVEHV